MLLSQKFFCLDRLLTDLWLNLERKENTLWTQHGWNEIYQLKSYERLHFYSIPRTVNIHSWRRTKELPETIYHIYNHNDHLELPEPCNMEFQQLFLTCRFLRFFMKVRNQLILILHLLLTLRFLVWCLCVLLLLNACDSKH